MPEPGWPEILDDLEAALQNEVTDAPAWRPPSAPGPLPASLRARAEHLLAAQLLRQRELSARRDELGRHRAVAQRVHATGAPRAPRYLDVAG